MHPKDLLAHACIRTRFSNGVIFDWEVEKNGRVVKISPPAKLIATHLGLALRAVHDGVGYWATFEGYVRYGVKSGRAGQRASTTGARRSSGPFLYYPSRRQPRPALAAVVSCVADWRKQARRKTRKSS